MIEWPRDETRLSEGGINPKRMDQRFLMLGISVDRKGPRKTVRGPLHMPIRDGHVLKRYQSQILFRSVRMLCPSSYLYSTASMVFRTR